MARSAWLPDPWGEEKEARIPFAGEGLVVWSPAAPSRLCAIEIEGGRLEEVVLGNRTMPARDFRKFVHAVNPDVLVTVRASGSPAAAVVRYREAVEVSS